MTPGRRIRFWAYATTAIAALFLPLWGAFTPGWCQQSAGPDTEAISSFQAFRRHRWRAASEAVSRHRDFLMGTKGVVATGTGIGRDGLPVVKVFTAGREVGYIPEALNRVPIQVEARGRFYARDVEASDLGARDRWPRPVPIGVSIGHPGVTAGTVGARVTDGAAVFVLSNNHVIADLNDAMIGDDILQPGRSDGGGAPEDVIGTLFDFERVALCDQSQSPPDCPPNFYDGAIAEVADPLTLEPTVGFATPSDGYGVPSADLHRAYGDPDILYDAGEDLSELIGTPVQKYGRATSQSSGTVDAISATVDVCYNSDCSRMARFVDQIIISPGSFSEPGDSGALIVTEDADKRAVGLLFAGNATSTIANRIDRVLIDLGVRIDEPPRAQADATGFQAAERAAHGVGSEWYSVIYAEVQPIPLAVFASLETFQGGDPAAPRIRYAEKTGFQVQVEEEQSANEETRHGPETIGYLALRPGRITNAMGETVAEVRMVDRRQDSGDQWHRLTYQFGSYPNPVAIGNLVTINGAAPCHVRFRKVAAQYLDYQIEEWDYLNKEHTTETIAFLVVRGGSHTLSDGRRLEAGVLEADHRWTPWLFSADFSGTPITFTHPQTARGRAAIVTRMDGLTRTGFQVRLQEEEANDGKHKREAVGYLAVGQR